MLDILKKLLERQSQTVALFVLGVIVFIIGATSSVPLWNPPLPISDMTSKLALGLSLLFIVLGTWLMVRESSSNDVTGARKARAVLLEFEEHKKISAETGNHLTIDSGFLNRDRCTLMLWAWVSKRGAGLRDEGDNHYLIAYHTGETKTGDCFNQFGLRCAYNDFYDDMFWEVRFSNAKGKYFDYYPCIQDQLEEGWHHFTVALDRTRHKMVLMIDAGWSGSDCSIVPLDCWPTSGDTKASVGAWANPDSVQLHCDTEVFRFLVFNEFLETSDGVVREYLEHSPPPLA